MNWIMKGIFLAIIMSFAFLNLQGQDKLPFKSVGVSEFAKAIADTSYVVLDVRTAEENAEGYIPGTDFNIDVLEDGFKAEALKLLPKGKTVALYCRSGNRSKNAARILSGSGYKVVELSTGIRGWAAEGKEIAVDKNE